MNRLSLRSVSDACKMVKFAPSKGDKIMRPGSLLALCLAVGGLAGPPARANLVANGGFETGDFTGWTVSDPSIQIDGAFAADGNFDAAFTGSSGTLSQGLLTTAGLSYTLSFLVADDAGYFLDTFHASFAGHSIDLTGDMANLVYVTEVLTVPGASVPANAVLSFQATSDPLAGGVWHLDDVSVVAATIPEPPVGAILASAMLIVLSLRFRARMIAG
jgi:hypothetical protein